MRISGMIRSGLLATAALLTLAVAGQSQTIKMGFVNDEKIKEGYKAFLRAQEQWEVEKKAWDDEATAKQTELQTMLEDYDKQKLILSEEKRKEREAAIRAKKDALDAFTRQIYSPGGTAERKQQDLLGPLLETVTKAIEAVALEEGYDVVFTLQSGLGYIKESYDITTKVLDKLEKLEK